MKLAKYLENGKTISGIEVTKDELIVIEQKVNYIAISNSNKRKIEKLDRLDTVGTIFGHIENIIKSLNLQEELKIGYDEFPIYENPECWFISKDYVNSNHKPLTSDTLFTFGEAISLLEKGYRVSRNAWDENVFLFFSTDEILTRIEDVTSRWSDYKVDPFIIMATAQKTFKSGWTPSQEDMLAEDFIIIGRTTKETK